MARLLLVLIVNGSEFHKTGAAWAKARSPSIEQLSEKEEKNVDETYMRMLQTVKLNVSWKDNVTNNDLEELHHL